MDFSSSRITRRAARVVSFALGSVFSAAVLANCAVMFQVAREEGKPLPSLTLGVTIEDTNRWLAVIVPAAVAYVWAVALPFATLAACASDVGRSRSALVAVFRVAKSIAFLASGILMVGVTARPMGSLFADPPATGRAGTSARRRRRVRVRAAAGDPVRRALARFVAKTHVSNGYGLFRQMTGVGENGDAARPELTLEASYDEEGTNWTPLVFKYKPGTTDVAPKFVAPHQPRLDWQMWFAALGRYNENAWFVAFVDRLLRGTPEVWGLLAEGLDVEAAPPKSSDRRGARTISRRGARRPPGLGGLSRGRRRNTCRRSRWITRASKRFGGLMGWFLTRAQKTKDRIRCRRLSTWRANTR